MNCPRCSKLMNWEVDHSCHEVNDGCDEGIVSFYRCKPCNLDARITTECECEDNE
jgi:hypothetical protein